MKKILLASGLIGLGLFGAAMWWPTTITGRVLHGETGEPVAMVRVFLRSDVYKPWWMLSALAYDDVTSSVGDRTRTDRNGEFTSWVFAGLRLDNASIGFRKRGYVVQPSLNSIYGGYLSSNLERNLSGSLTRDIIFADVHAWPASQQIDKGERRPGISLDGSERLIRLGKQKRLLFLKLIRASGPAPVTITARYENGTIRTAEGRDRASLVAPDDDYQAEARADTDCENEVAVVFFLRDEANHYGRVSIDPLSLCRQRERMRLEYRLNNESGIRALLGENEIPE